MDSSSNDNWTVFHGDRRQRRQQQAFPSAFGQKNEGRSGNFAAFGRRNDGSGDRRGGFPAAFGGQRQRGERRDPAAYSRDWYEQQRVAKEQEEQAARNAQEKTRELNDVNFPELVSSFTGAPAQSSRNGHGWNQRGSDLARAWGEAEQQQKDMERLQQIASEERDFRNQVFERSVVALPRRTAGFGGFNRSDVDDYPEEEQQSSSHTAVAAGAGQEETWATVDNSKKRRPVQRSGMWHHLTECEETAEDDTVWGGKKSAREDEDSVW
jgi:hypothetical protein